MSPLPKSVRKTTLTFVFNTDARRRSLRSASKDNATASHARHVQTEHGRAGPLHVSVGEPCSRATSGLARALPITGTNFHYIIAGEMRLVFGVWENHQITLPLCVEKKVLSGSY